MHPPPQEVGPLFSSPTAPTYQVCVANFPRQSKYKGALPFHGPDMPSCPDKPCKSARGDRAGLWRCVQSWFLCLQPAPQRMYWRLPLPGGGRTPPLMRDPLPMWGLTHSPNSGCSHASRTPATFELASRPTGSHCLKSIHPKPPDNICHVFS